MLNLDELKKLRAGYIAAAEQNVAEFINTNRPSLQQFITATIENLEARDTSGVKIASYQLFSAAKSFDRLDLTNISEMLYKLMGRPQYANDENVFQVFEMAVKTLARSDIADQKLEDEITLKIYEVLRSVPK